MKNLSMVRIVGSERQIAQIKVFIEGLNQESTEDVAAIVVKDWTFEDSAREVRSLINEWQEENSHK